MGHVVSGSKVSFSRHLVESLIEDASFCTVLLFLPDSTKSSVGLQQGCFYCLLDLVDQSHLAIESLPP